jgi:hypothetical protein
MRKAMLALAAACLTVAVSAAVAKDEVKPFIKCPKTWEAAIEEAKALNLPIVVHSHGFY